jgi:hypothetical protein
MQENSARLASEREARPVPSVVEAASQKVEETSARLKALREMYAREIGADASLSTLAEPAQAKEASPGAAPKA